MNNIISFEKLGLCFNVNRAALNIGGFSVYWYGVIIVTGLVLALLYGYLECKKNGLKQDDYFNMVLIAIPSAIICARLYYVIFSFDMYKSDLLSVFDIRSGGLAIYGGVIGAAVAVLVYCKKKKINAGIVLDMLAVGLLIGQCIGRWGNFVNGEAFGGATNLPWAMTIVNNGRTIADSVHPTFLYESLWNFVGIFVLLGYKRIKKFNGELFCGYMVWYGIGRAMIEGLRADSLYIGELRVSQILALCCTVAGIILIVYGRRYIKKREDKELKAVIFDLDGVIVTTDDCHFGAWKMMADEEGIYFDRTINERLRGVSRMESLAIILERAEKEYTEEEKVALATRKNGYYVELIQKLEPTDILPGVMDNLKKLKANGIKIAIGSSSKNTPIILKRIGLDNYFDAVSDGNNISNSKPDPEVFLKAAEMLSVDPADCAIVEDADSGIIAGKRAGMKTVAVGTAEGGDYYFKSLETVDLTELFK